MSVYKHQKFDAQLLDNDLFFISFKADVICDKGDFEASVEAYNELGNGKIMKVIAVFPKYTHMTYEAQKFLESRPIPAIAEAVVFESLAQRLLFKFYQSMRSTKYPVKGFQNFEAAMDWISKA